LTIRTEIQVGRENLILETGRMARQADSAVVVRYGGTVVLVTAQAQRKAREGVDFLPLTVDYRENTYAAGKIPGGFFKREGRPNEKEILTSRLIDRPIRPLFPAGWNCETQVIALVLSSDQANDSDVLALTGAGAALALSDIPFSGTPLAAARVGLIDGEYVLNPTFQDLERSRLDLVVAGTADAVVMVEAGAREVSEEETIEAIYRGHEEVRRIAAGIAEMCARAGRPKRAFTPRRVPEDLARRLEERALEPLREAMHVRGKLDSYRHIALLSEEVLGELPEEEAESRTLAQIHLQEMQNRILREEVFRRGTRLDGRRFDEIRPITCEVGLLPRTHGSSLFTRGETQALVTATLGTKEDVQRLDWLEGESERRFLLHYNFPPFSVGEVRFLRGPGRREIGHGALAARALEYVMPSREQFPYTVRVVSDILESNGSSSMATICGGALALMDAGVPIHKPVAGVAMGLVMDSGEFRVLTDIAGAEDHHGDMDFKVAGTRDGITALQMDIKIGGVSREIMAAALDQAHAGRIFILDRMATVLAEPRPEISSFAPRILTLVIPKDKIREVIGPGGKMIRSIVERTGCKIDVEDDGTVNIASVDLEAARQAREIIEELTAEAEVGKTYLGKVQRLTGFGAFVEIMPNVEGLLHISEVAHYHVPEIHDELAEGDEVMVKVIEMDGSGRIRLSRKALLPKQEMAAAGGRGEPGGGGGPAARRRRGRRPGRRP
jgi:polyribonucleotide nucleotidyltransferase